MHEAGWMSKWLLSQGILCIYTQLYVYHEDFNSIYEYAFGQISCREVIYMPQVCLLIF